jgi:hypothetical protein
MNGRQSTNRDVRVNTKVQDKAGDTAWEHAQGLKTKIGNEENTVAEQRMGSICEKNE